MEEEQDKSEYMKEYIQRNPSKFDSGKHGKLFTDEELIKLLESLRS